MSVGLGRFKDRDMATVFSKTEAGQREIRERSLGLSRPARTVLVLADGSRTQEQLLQMVQGATPADVTGLVDAGLLAASGGSGAASRGAPSTDAPPLATEPMPFAATAPIEVPVAAAAAAPAADALGYRELYDSLNALAKEQLGLFRGYKFVLEIEKASGVEGLREVAEKFAVEVQKVKGDSAAQMVRRALGLIR